MPDEEKKKKKNEEPLEEPLAIVPQKFRKVTEGQKMGFQRPKKKIIDLDLDKDLDRDKED